MKKVNYFTLLFCVTSSLLFSQTIITDRPDQTESSSTIKKGNLQIETGFLVGFSEDENFSERQILAPSNLFRYGLTNGIELRVLNQFESLKDQLNSQTVSGISDLEIGTKVQFLRNENVNTEIAFLSHIILPTGSKGLSNEKFGTINKLSISHALNENMDLGYNIGYDYFGVDSGNLTYSIALGIGVSEKFGIYLEPYGALVNFETHESNFDAGVTYLIQDHIQFDFSFGTGINHTMNYMAIGCSIEIEKQNKK